MTSIQVNAIRRRVEHSLSPATASAASDGMTVANLQQFVAGNFLPSEVQLTRLVNYLGVKF